MTGWAKAWVAWGSATAVSFSVIEAKALQVPGATLSEHLRKVFGFDDRGPAPHIRRLAFYGVWGWFGLHILRRATGCVSEPVLTIPPS